MYFVVPIRPAIFLALMFFDKIGLSLKNKLLPIFAALCFHLLVNMMKHIPRKNILFFLFNCLKYNIFSNLFFNFLKS